MRRRTVSEGIQKEAKLLLRLFLTEPERFKHKRLCLRIMDTN